MTAVAGSHGGSQTHCFHSGRLTKFMVIPSLYFHERADVINFITQECCGTPLAEIDHAYRGSSVHGSSLLHAHVLFHDRQVLGKLALRRSGSSLGYARFTSNYSSFTVTLAPDHPPQLWHPTHRRSLSCPPTLALRGHVR